MNEVHKEILFLKVSPIFLEFKTAKLVLFGKWYDLSKF